MDQYNQEQVLSVLQTGIRKGKRAYRRKQVIKSVTSVMSIFILIFSVMVNVSPSFADALIDIPVIGEIVELIRLGSGYEEVAEQGMFEKGDTFYRDDTYTLELVAYYFSDHDVNMYLQLNSNEDASYMIQDYKITDQNDQTIEDYSLGLDSFDTFNDYITNIDIKSLNKVLPDTLTFKFDVTRRQGNKKDVVIKDVEITLDKKIKDVVKIISINQTTATEDVEVTLHQIEISPTNMNLQLDVKTNGLAFYDFKEIYIQSKDKKYPLISNGLVRSGDLESGYTYLFKSPFFDENQELEVVINGIKALPQDKANLIVDIEDKKITDSFDDSLELIGIDENHEEYIVKLKSKQDEKIRFSSYNGEYFSQTSYMSGEGFREYHLYCKKEFVNDKIIIDFNDYPNIYPFNLSIQIN